MCDQLQQMELDRIRCLRNSSWLFANYISDLCCFLDDSRENIRLSAEKCNEDDDVRNFTLNNTTCNKPLPPIEYIAFGWFSSDKSSHNSLKSNGSSVPSIKTQTPHTEEDWDDGPDDVEIYVAQFDYIPQSNDEMALRKGETFHLIEQAETGWVRAENVKTQRSGLVPMNYLNPCGRS